MSKYNLDGSTRGRPGLVSIGVLCSRDENFLVVFSKNAGTLILMRRKCWQF